jgi:hypothetical protein
MIHDLDIHYYKKQPITEKIGIIISSKKESVEWNTDLYRWKY